MQLCWRQPTCRRPLPPAVPGTALADVHRPQSGHPRGHAGPARRNDRCLPRAARRGGARHRLLRVPRPADHAGRTRRGRSSLGRAPAGPRFAPRAARGADVADRPGAPVHPVRAGPAGRRAHPRQPAPARGAAGPPVRATRATGADRRSGLPAGAGRVGRPGAGVPLARRADAARHLRRRGDGSRSDAPPRRPARAGAQLRHHRRTEGGEQVRSPPARRRPGHPAADRRRPRRHLPVLGVAAPRLRRRGGHRGTARGFQAGDGRTLQRLAVLARGTRMRRHARALPRRRGGDADEAAPGRRRPGPRGAHRLGGRLPGAPGGGVLPSASACRCARATG
jgi:hypothetical protein